jgi:hypothetical protein
MNMMINARDLYLEAAHLPEYIKSEKMAKEAVKTVPGMVMSSPEDKFR